MKISLFTKKAVYENTFIGDLPEPEPKKDNCFGSGFGSGQKGRLRLRNIDFNFWGILCTVFVGRCKLYKRGEGLFDDPLRRRLNFCVL